MRRLECAILGSVLLLLDCSELAGIEEIPCQPACKDGTTRIFCDADGNPRTEACPRSSEECAAPACEAGTCTFKPAVGAACGETPGAKCNEGFACLGGSFYIDAIRQHTCIATDDGKVWCWGDNTYRELGDGTTRPGLHPVLVRGLPGHAIRVNTGYAHTCALLRGGTIYCWGNNEVGQCGVPPSDPISEPVLVDVPGVLFTRLMTGQGHTCAVAEDKSVYCWGNTSHGQCGIDPEVTGQHIVDPTRVDGLDNVEIIMTVKNHTCVVRTEDPTLMCWGSNTHIEEGHINYKLGPAAGDLPYSAHPLPVDLGAPVISPGMGFESTYAMTAEGVIYAWGRNARLQLGTGSREPIGRTPSPVRLETGSGLVPLTGGETLIRSDGSDQCVTAVDRSRFGAAFLCWGADDWGEIGVGTSEGARTTHHFPVPVRAVPATAVRLVRGEDHACAAVVIQDHTEIWCYGRPGVLGNGTARPEDGTPPTQWQGAPVVWDPANFAPTLD